MDLFKFRTLAVPTCKKCGKRPCTRGFKDDDYLTVCDVCALRNLAAALVEDLEGYTLKETIEARATARRLNAQADALEKQF